MAGETQRAHPEMGAETKITVKGRDTDRESLWDWLRHEPELHGWLRAASGKNSIVTGSSVVISIRRHLPGLAVIVLSRCAPNRRSRHIPRMSRLSRSTTVWRHPAYGWRGKSCRLRDRIICR
jgi:hypothetical protein